MDKISPQDSNSKTTVSIHPPKDEITARMVKGNLLMLTATIFFGVDLPVLKYLIPTWMTAVDATIFRIVGATALMWIASLFVKTQKIEKSDYRVLFFCGFIGMFGFMYLFNLALKYGSAIDVSIIMTTPPVLVIIYDIIFRKMRFSRMELLGVVMALLGAVMIILIHSGASSKGGDVILGDIFAFASAVVFTGYLIAIEKPSKKYNSVSLMRWVMLAGSLPALCLVWMLPSAHIFAHPALSPWLGVGFIIIFPTFVSYILTSPALKLVGSEVVSLYQYFVPVVATITALIMKIDKLQWYQPIAICIILIGVFITNRAKQKRFKTMNN
jgi:drug/metabolite transporter (DMT)-like permease